MSNGLHLAKFSFQLRPEILLLDFQDRVLLVFLLLLRALLQSLFSDSSLYSQPLSIRRVKVQTLVCFFFPQSVLTPLVTLNRLMTLQTASMLTLP